MSLFVAMAAVIASVLALAWAFSKARTETAVQGLRILLGLGGLILGVVLTVRGLAVVGGPLIAAALGFLGMAARRSSRGESGPRTKAGGGSAGTEASTRGMSREEAAAVLGVSERASDDEIRKAYRDMMKRAHPDAGGTDALAARVQLARDVLLAKR